MNEEISLSMRIRSRIGSLIQITGAFFWYSNRTWVDTTEWVAIVLEAHPVGECKDVPVVEGHGEHSADSTAVRLILDGRERWFWLSSRDVKFL